MSPSFGSARSVFRASRPFSAKARAASAGVHSTSLHCGLPGWRDRRRDFGDTSQFLPKPGSPSWINTAVSARPPLPPHSAAAAGCSREGATTLDRLFDCGQGHHRQPPKGRRLPRAARPVRSVRRSRLSVRRPQRSAMPVATRHVRPRECSTGCCATRSTRRRRASLITTDRPSRTGRVPSVHGLRGATRLRGECCGCAR